MKKVYIAILLSIISLSIIYFLFWVFNYHKVNKSMYKEMGKSLYYKDKLNNEKLSEAENKFWESQTEENIKMEEVLLPNGENALDFLCKYDKEFIAKFGKEDLSKCKN